MVFFRLQGFALNALNGFTHLTYAQSYNGEFTFRRKLSAHIRKETNYMTKIKVQRAVIRPMINGELVTDNTTFKYAEKTVEFDTFTVDTDARKALLHVPGKAHVQARIGGLNDENAYTVTVGYFDLYVKKISADMDEYPHVVIAGKLVE